MIENSPIMIKRNMLREQFIQQSDTIKDGKIVNVCNKDLKILFNLYDELFLDNYFAKNFKGTINFAFSKRLKTSAGVTKSQKHISTLLPEQYVLEINISLGFLENYYATDREIYVNGFKTKDSLEAMLLVFEHELCHVIEILTYHKSFCSKDRFKTMAYRLFGHTDVTHAMPTKSEINSKKYNINPGDEINFKFENTNLKGIVSAVNKRLTVMVKDSKGPYVDKQGTRYTKYYVPLETLPK